MTEPIHFDGVSLLVTDVERSVASRGFKRLLMNREEELQ